MAEKKTVTLTTVKGVVVSTSEDNAARLPSELFTPAQAEAKAAPAAKRTSDK